MKLSKIKSIVKTRKALMVTDDDTTMWVGDGHALYALFGMPMMSQRQIMQLLDIPDADIEKYAIIQPRAFMGMSFADAATGETPVALLPITIHAGGVPLLPVKTECGIYVLNSHHLSPFDGGDINIHLRYTASRMPYFAVKEGMFISGIIMPQKISEKVMQTLEQIVDLGNVEGTA